MLRVKFPGESKILYDKRQAIGQSMSGSSIEAVWALKELKTSEGERLMSVSISCVEGIQPDILGAMKAEVNQSALLGMYRDLFVGQFQPPCATPWLPLGICAYYRTISFLPVKIVIELGIT